MKLLKVGKDIKAVGFKDYKIRDGVHIPSKKYKANWDAIFGKKNSSLDDISKSTKGVKDAPRKRKTINRDTQKINT